MRASMVKFRDIVAETQSENARRGEFVRIFPAKNCRMYDKFLSRSAINKIVYKALFTHDFLPYPGQSSQMSCCVSPSPSPLLRKNYSPTRPKPVYLQGGKTNQLR
jgi:hypothetical protein